MVRPRTRSEFLADGGRVAAGLAGIGFLTDPAWAFSTLPIRASISFEHAAPRPTWNDGTHTWLTALGHRVRGVGGGAAYIEIPHGSPTSASAQPCPVFLLDHDCGAFEQAMVFTVSTTTAAVGLLFGGQSGSWYLTVTIRGGELAIVQRTRTSSAARAVVRIPVLRPGAVYRLVVRQDGSRVFGRVEPESSTRRWQVTVPHTPAPGMVGVVMSGGPLTQRTRLRVLRYWLRAAAVTDTPMRERVLIAGAPSTADLRHPVQRVRVIAERGCRAQIEVSADPSFGSLVGSSPAAMLSVPPFTLDHRFPLAPGTTLWWRARLRSSTGGERVTPAQRIAMPDAGDRLVMAAASCALLWDAPGYTGLRRLTQEAASQPPAMLVFAGDMGYASNTVNQAYVNDTDYWTDRLIRFLRDPSFIALRAAMPTCLVMDDHDYGYINNADRTTLAPWTIDQFNKLQADPTTTGYVDWRYGDVHCMTLDGRRYCDPVTQPESSTKTKLGIAQKARLRTILTTSDAGLFVLFSGSSWAIRGGDGSVENTFVRGWTTEFRELMTLFHTTQLRGKRVVILSGDAHSQCIHYHPDPFRRTGTGGHPVIEFICAGLRARTWTGPWPHDPTLDPLRHVTGKSGLGLIEIDAPTDPNRSILMRAINGDEGPLDLFPRLVVPYAA